VPHRESVLGFAAGCAVIVAGFVFDLPPFIGWVTLAVIFGGWFYFAMRDRRDL
jgi:hypothetical protein